MTDTTQEVTEERTHDIVAEIAKIKRPKVAVLGGGSWATAIVKVLTDNKVKVRWWMRDTEAVDHILQYNRNIKYLPTAELKMSKSRVSTDINAILRKSDIVFVVIPSAFLSDALSEVEPGILDGKLIVSAIKGMVSTRNEVIADFFKNEFNILPQNFCVIAGPSHAEEVAEEKLSYLTIAGIDSLRTTQIAAMLGNHYIKTLTSPDIYGTEYSAVMKNIYALATGIALGAGYGDNFVAVLVSNAIREIKTFTDAIHPIDRDINESAYLGDLLVTCFSPHSRNRRFGSLIGKGYTVKSAQTQMNMVAEGYYAAKCIYDLNRNLMVDLPITSAVYHILYDKVNPKLEFHLLSQKLS
jgi:glycerol-3-phosphate dehydrogenase (NAD(P)+)